jgi:signal transduction histidine kinase/DNA-binding response OmpR family regulator
MTDTTHEEYKQRIEELGQALLDVISSVALGDFDVQIDIPEDIDVFADLAVGLEFMIEDLRELAKAQETARVELEQKIAQRAQEIEISRERLEQDSRTLEGRSNIDLASEQVKSLTYSKSEGIKPASTWLPSMNKALTERATTSEANGQDTQTLSLPIQLHDQVIGVIGFNRSKDQPWTSQEIATLEAISEQLGLALENQRLFEQTQTALSEADTLYKATAELNTAQDYTDILTALKKYSQLGGEASEIHIGLFDQIFTQFHHPQNITFIAGIPDSGEHNFPRTVQFPELSRLSEMDIISADKITTIQTSGSEEIISEEWLNAFPGAVDGREIAFLPLVVGGRWIGLIDCVYPNEIAFSEVEIRRTSSISSQASVAIQNLRSIEVAEQRAREAQRRSEELALINRVVSAVTASPDLQESLRLVAKELNQAASVDETSIALLNDARDTLTYVAFISRLPGLPNIEGEELPMEGNKLVAKLIIEKNPIVLQRNDFQASPSPVYDLMLARNYTSLVLMPLTAGTETIGIITLGLQSEDEKVDEGEMRLAETILLQASTAIQNARLLNQTQTALMETANLYQANRDLNGVQNYQDILNVLQQYTMLGDNSIYSGIFLFDTPLSSNEIPATITPIAQFSINPEDKFEDTPIPYADWPTLPDFMKLDSHALVRDIESDHRLFGIFHETFYSQQQAEIVLSIPLAVAGRWVGQIYAAYPEEINVSESDLRRLNTLSGQAAIAIDNIGLLEETSRRANQLETAAEISQQATSTLDTGALLNRAVNLIRDRFGYYHSSIFLIEGNQAKIAASTGEAGKQLIESDHTLKLQEGGSIIGHVCYSGESLIVNDVSQNPTHLPHPLLPETRAELGIPLKIGDRVTGALDVQSTQVNAFNEDDMAVLQTLADQIAIALDNARSYELSQQAVEEMREVDRLKSEFLANMSHELRTPLNSIIGFSRVILKGIDGPINELQEQDLMAIHNSGQHLLDMINNILDLSKIEAGKMELNIEPIQIDSVMDGVISTARGLVKEKPIKLLTDLPETLPLVSGDRTRVRQILLNLLQNASKFTDQGTITVKATVLENEGSLRIGVKDTGIGISPEDQTKLFERFSQVDSSLTRKVGGSGLGLSITKLLVELQGGEIDLESTVGEGSHFWFTLPIASAAPKRAEVEEKTEEITKDSKIIVSIDDDQKVIDLYKRYLRNHGYQVIAITEPNGVINKLKEIQPFAITLDIMMPKKDGWQVIQEIKNDPETAHIPVIVCSIVEEKDKAYQLGAVDYLVKPILEEELVNAVSRLELPKDKEFYEILIIDDDPHVFELIEIALRDHPRYQLAFADGGFAGLDYLNEKKPDAVILDLIMPDLNGFSILETMQGNPDQRDIPVIILTAANLTPSERKMLEQNKREVLIKSEFQEHHLIDYLESALEKISKREKER